MDITDGELAKEIAPFWALKKQWVSISVTKK